jgi:CheY-like chemotaxis protein
VNARDAMPEGGRVVIETASIDRIPAPGAQDDNAGAGYVLIAVSDGGIGMDADVVSKAFDPFFTTKEAGRGTGLGLSQVYGFVRQSGGQVLIDSRPGEGTTVRIYLPRLTDETEPPEPDSWSPSPQDIQGSETILVVEDDDAVRAYSTDALRDLGYRVLEAPNASAALEILDRQADVRLLFTDIGLPGAMNGPQLRDEARRRRPNLKVLFTTGYMRDVAGHPGRLDPGDALIRKPFSFADLTQKIRTALDSGE